MINNLTLKRIDDVSIIKMDDGKVNVFSIEILEKFRTILSEIPRNKGSLIITGRDGIFSGGFNLKTFQAGEPLLLPGVLAGDPGQAPLEVGQHVLHGFGPVLLAVELSLDGECASCHTIQVRSCSAVTR